MKLSHRVSGVLAVVGAGLIAIPAGARAEGMPQLDFSTPLTISQVVWGTIIFVVLYILLSRNALPLVASVLDERAAMISRDLDEARAAGTRANAGIAEADQAIAKARAEAQAAINAAVNEAKNAASQQAEALNTRLEKQLEESEAQIAQARASAMGALRQVATETAATVVARLTGVAPDQRQLDGAIVSALAARGIG